MLIPPSLNYGALQLKLFIDLAVTFCCVVTERGLEVDREILPLNFYRKKL